MRYGKRIRNGNNGNIEWCQLDEPEVAKVLLDNVDVNTDVFEKCFDVALQRFTQGKEHRNAVVEMNPDLRRETLDIAIALFSHCAVKSFIALQKALEQRAHEQKSDVMA